MDKRYRYLFGPVPSRRFGRSLGVDLSRPKTCSLDCIFCQLGRSSMKSVDRKEYVPTEMVLAELKDWISTDGRADYITLSGSGEPTLHSRFGDVLKFIREHTAVPALLLTNGTMLHHPEVRTAACQADTVKASLSAWDDLSYRRINRPHPALRFDTLVEGEKAFRKEYTGTFFLEVFLVRGINTAPDDIKRIAALTREIAPDRVQLNTAVRPPAEEVVAALNREELKQISTFFDPEAEIIAASELTDGDPLSRNQDAILAMLRRRPCTADDIAGAFTMHMNEVSKYLGILIRNKRIVTEHRNGLVYYTVPSGRKR